MPTPERENIKMETTYVSRERAITEINNMKNEGAVLYYFNGNTYTFEFEGRIHAVDTADGQGLNNWQIMDFDWSDRYINNNSVKEWGIVA